MLSAVRWEQSPTCCVPLPPDYLSSVKDWDLEDSDLSLAPSLSRYLTLGKRLDLSEFVASF